MSTDAGQPHERRIHQVALQVCNKLFVGPNDRCVYVADPIPLEVARSKGWSPLLMYSITVEGLPIRSTFVCPLDQPVPIVNVLMHLWARDPWLRGWPDEIKLSPALYGDATALVEALEAQGAIVTPVPGRERSYEANRRAALGTQSVWDFGARSARATANVSVDKVNSSMREREEIHHRYSAKGTIGRQQQAAWLALPDRSTPSGLRTRSDLDWRPGEWLMLPFRSVVMGSNERVSKARGEPSLFVIESGVSDDLYSQPEHEQILAAWPESIGAVARQIGASEAELRGFLRGRSTLSRAAVHALNQMLHLEWEYQGSESYLEPMGPYLFTPSTKQSATRAWDGASCGGDLEYACELVPDSSGVAEGAEHVIAFQRCGSYPSFMLIPRQGGDDKLPAKWANALLNLSAEPEELPYDQFAEIRAVLLSVLRFPDRRDEGLRAIGVAYGAFFDGLSRW